MLRAQEKNGKEGTTRTKDGRRGKKEQNDEMRRPND